MHKKVSKKKDEILFYFPEDCKINDVPGQILKMVKDDKRDEVYGFPDDAAFLLNLKKQMGKNEAKNIFISNKQLVKLEKIIFEFTEKVVNVLDIKYGVRFFVLPWFPTEVESKKFGGVHAQIVFYGTIYLFVDIKKFTKKSLEATLAHELNHAKFYERSENLFFPIKENLVLEGLAECFRIDLVGGAVAPWSKIFKEKDFSKYFSSVKDILESRDRKIFENLFYGGGKYQRWSGYTLGYYLVRNYLRRQNLKDWRRIMKIQVDEYFKNIYNL